MPSFRHLVGNVVSLCADMQMCRVNTRRIVARVHNNLTRQKGASSQHHCISMRPGRLTSHREHPIPTLIDRTEPQPAFAIAPPVYLIPKAINLGHTLPRHRDRWVPMLAPSLVMRTTESATKSRALTLIDLAFIHTAILAVWKRLCGIQTPSASPSPRSP